jgi:septal ring factor EnvC (AmiA/AmiB activator)
MSRSERPSGLSINVTRLGAFAALLSSVLLAGGCIVTEDKLQKKLESLEAQIRSSSTKGLESYSKQLDEMDRKIEENQKNLKALEVSLTAMKTDILAIKGNIERVFKAERTIDQVRIKAEKALAEAKDLRTQSRNSLSGMRDHVDSAIGKYREMLLEERRLLTERLRFISSSLRKLEEKNDKK